MSNISLVETDLINEKIQIIIRQTDYSEEIALEKLKDNNFDEIKTIKAYFGIEEKNHPKLNLLIKKFTNNYVIN